MSEHPVPAIQSIAQIIEIIGLMEALREGFEQTVIAVNVTPLQGVHEDKKAARLQDPRNFGAYFPANLIRKLMIKKNARRDVEASRFEGQCLRVCLSER